METMETKTQGCDGSIVGKIRYWFNKGLNAFCHDAVDIEGTNVCPNYAPRCPYRLPGKYFSTQEAIECGIIKIVPDIDYIICGKEPKT